MKLVTTNARYIPNRRPHHEGQRRSATVARVSQRCHGRQFAMWPRENDSIFARTSFRMTSQTQRPRCLSSSRCWHHHGWGRPRRSLRRLLCTRGCGDAALPSVGRQQHPDRRTANEEERRQGQLCRWADGRATARSPEMHDTASAARRWGRFARWHGGRRDRSVPGDVAGRSNVTRCKGWRPELGSASLGTKILDTGLTRGAGAQRMRQRTQRQATQAL